MIKDPVGPLTIINTDEEIELSKRFRMPVICSSACPSCKKVVTLDMSEVSYLSYPRTNRPEIITMFHECDNDIITEWNYEVVVKVTLEVITR
jgi:hypothetical protein